MIGWLIDLFFSNFWIFIILYWVLRAFSKSGKTEKSKSRPVRRTVPSIPSAPRPQVDRERDFEPVIPQPVQTMVPFEPKQVERKKEEHVHVYKKLKEIPASDGFDLIPPVQGMIWSEIYGPPRSKQPHRRKKR